MCFVRAGRMLPLYAFFICTIVQTLRPHCCYSGPGKALLDGHRSSCFLSQFCEDGERLEDLNIKWLAVLSTDTIISKIHSRVAGRPAGMVLLSSIVVFQVEERLFIFSCCFCFFFFPSCWFIKFHKMKGILSLTENEMLLVIYCFNILSNLYLCICLLFPLRR